MKYSLTADFDGMFGSYIEEAESPEAAAWKLYRRRAREGAMNPEAKVSAQIEALAAQLTKEEQQRVADCSVCLAHIVRAYGKPGLIALALLGAKMSEGT